MNFLKHSLMPRRGANRRMLFALACVLHLFPTPNQLHLQVSPSPAHGSFVLVNQLHHLSARSLETRPAAPFTSCGPLDALASLSRRHYCILVGLCRPQSSLRIHRSPSPAVIVRFTKVKQNQPKNRWADAGAKLDTTHRTTIRGTAVMGL